MVKFQKCLKCGKEFVPYAISSYVARHTNYEDFYCYDCAFALRTEELKQISADKKEKNVNAL